MSFEKILTGLAKFQYKYKYFILIFIILLSVFMAFGVTKVRMQSDMSKDMPSQLPIYQLNDRIDAKFGGQDRVFILFKLKEESNEKTVAKDIRNHEIINYIIDLNHILQKESSVNKIISPALYFQNHVTSTDQVKLYSKQIPSLNSFFSDDYKKTYMILLVDVGESEEKILSLTNLINEKINSVTMPADLEIMVTGNASMRVDILDLLKHDAIYTIIIASIFILIILFILEKSFTKGLLVFIPLMLGLMWTMGTMGWTNLKISMATAGLGAMILGLGVEYGTFMLTRYKEEREKGKNQLNSIKVAVPAIGSAVLGSGLTTITGFLALTFSFMPMLQKLGISLALGIAWCLFASIFAAPIIILLEEDFEYWVTHRNHKKLSSKLNKHKRLKK